MKAINYFSLFLGFSLIALFSCDKYDDDRIWKDLDEINQTLTSYEAQAQTLTQQMSALNQLFNSSFVSLISQDAQGNYIISYTNEGGDSHTLTLAPYTDVVQQPLFIGKQDTDGIYYWAITQDKGKTYQFYLTPEQQKIPVNGIPPQIAINEQGYWMVNGNSTGVLAQDIGNLLFKSAYIDSESQEAVFVLANGQEIRLSAREALGIQFDASTFTPITSYSSPVIIPYQLIGTLAAKAQVELFTAYNLDVVIDRSSSSLQVSMKDGATEGNLLLLANVGNHTVVKPLYFTYGVAVIEDPVYQGTTLPINLLGKATEIEVQITASISYEVNSSESWISYSGTRSTTTTRHLFAVAANESGDERTAVLSFSNSLYNVSTSIPVLQEPQEAEAKGGISTAADLMAFAKAVNQGSSTARWQNAGGDVVLLNSIDMTGVNNWVPIGDVDASSYTTAIPYAAVNPFSGTFDGQGFAILNLDYSRSFSFSQLTYGLFGSIENATLKNLSLGSSANPGTWVLSGTAPKYTTVGALVGFAKNSVIENCHNYINIDFTADNKNGELVSLAGIAGTIYQTKIGGSAKALGCTNRGFVRTGAIANTGNGGTGMQTAGICGFMAKIEGNELDYCVNYGDISSPSGRTGGLVATLMFGNIKNSDNRGTIEDDKAGQYRGQEGSQTAQLKRMGGLVGGTDALTARPEFTVEYCTNYGTVITHLSARTGGFIGHSNIQIIGCVNKGAIIGDVFVEGNGINRHGPGWACGFSGASTATWTNVKGCAKGGYVGAYQFKDDPTAAPEATNENAFCHAPERFDASINF